MRWPAVVGAVVIGLAAVVVSLLASAGWALIFLEAAGASLAVFLFVRAQQTEDSEDPEPRSDGGDGRR